VTGEVRNSLLETLKKGTQTENAGGFQTVSHTCCGKKARYVAGFVLDSSDQKATGNTGRSGTRHKQQHGPQTQQMGIGQTGCLLFSSSWWSAQESSEELGVQFSLGVQLPPE
jgi:hypothetical protein